LFKFALITDHITVLIIIGTTQAVVVIEAELTDMVRGSLVVDAVVGLIILDRQNGGADSLLLLVGHIVDGRSETFISSLKLGLESLLNWWLLIYELFVL